MDEDVYCLERNGMKNYRWIRCRATFKYGYGQWEYVRVPITADKHEIIELVEEAMYTDPEGIRPVQFEFEPPPKEHLEKEIEYALNKIATLKDYIDDLRDDLKELTN